MKSLLASVRSLGGLDRVDHAVQWLEDEWRKHGDVPLERVWSDQKRLFESAADDSVVVLAELIKTDLRCRFARGQSPAVADYLEQFPELGDANSRVLSLIYEEFCLAEERGDQVDVEAFCDRYPRWKDSLVSQLQYHHLFSQAAGVRPKPTPFPEPGDSFEEFELTALLGRGGTSRVFLARDLSLGGKQVVLKVSLDRGREPQAQGALDHPHIVPVNSVVFGDEGMRGLSMPYRPGLPLDEVIRRVNPALTPCDAMALWRALVNPTQAEPGSEARPRSVPPPEVRPACPKGDGWEGFPVRGTYAQGVAWVVKVIAEALQYAHDRRTFHRDVKPANVLLAVQYGPQLLDFNLAESPHSAAQAQAAMHGGTLPYMAPEQIEAFLNPDLWGKVGARADIYSLGLVLRELLTGQAPDLPAETLAPARAMRVLLDRRPMLDVSVRRSNPAIPHALEAIVARCLKVPVEERYPDAGALADDLDRFLVRRPLVHAANPSRRERGTNWAIRNGRRLAIAAAFVAFLGAGALADRLLTGSRPSGPIADSEEFRAAVGLLNPRDAEYSQDAFRRLVRLYPDSYLAKAYLGLAYDAGSHQADGGHVFLETVGVRDALRELVAWSPNDPALPGRLRQFIQHRFDIATAIEKDAQPEGGPGKGLDEQYRLAKWAATIGLEIAPDSHDFDYALAKAEQELREYDSVIRLAGRALRSLEREVRPDRPWSPQLWVRANRWRWLRARAYTMLADRLGSEDPKQALRDLDLARGDLDASSNYNSSHPRDVTDLRYLEKIKLVASMKRVEILLRLENLRAAGAELARARDVLKNYDDYAKLSPHKEDRDYGYRKRQEMDNLRAQWRRLEARGVAQVPPGA